MNNSQIVYSTLNKINECLKKKQKNCYDFCTNKLSISPISPINLINHNDTLFINNEEKIIIPKNSFIYRTDKKNFNLQDVSLFYGSLHSAFDYLNKKNNNSNALIMFMTLKNLNLLILNNFKYKPISDEIESIMLYHLLNVCLPSIYVCMEEYKVSLYFLYSNMDKLIEILYIHLDENYVERSLDDMKYILKKLKIYFDTNEIHEKLIFQSISIFVLDKIIQSLLYKYTVDYEGYIYISEINNDLKNSLLFRANIISQLICVPFEFCVFNAIHNLKEINRFTFISNKQKIIMS